jgi:hypothetical protein
LRDFRVGIRIPRGVDRAVGIGRDLGNAIAWQPADHLEVAAGDHIRSRERDGQDLAVGIRAPCGVESAVGIEPREVGDRVALDALEEAADIGAAVRREGDRVDLRRDAASRERDEGRVPGARPAARRAQDGCSQPGVEADEGGRRRDRERVRG